MGVFIHFIPRGLVLLFNHFPSQNAFVFSTLSTNPEKFLKAFIVQIVSKACPAEATSAQNKLVSAANWLSLISEPKILIPLMVEFCFILLDSVSAVKINRYGESGHPCLTPLESLNQSVAKPLFKADLSMSM